MSNKPTIEDQAERVKQALYELPAPERAIMCLIIDRLRPQDAADFEYSYPASILFAACGTDDIEALKDIMQALFVKSIALYVDESAYTYARFIRDGYIAADGCTVSFRVDEDLRPYLIGAKDIIAAGSATGTEQAAAPAGGSCARPGAQAAPISTAERAEMEKLRAENETLRAKLDEEREAARQQADRILSLAERLADFIVK